MHKKQHHQRPQTPCYSVMPWRFLNTWSNRECVASDVISPVEYLTCQLKKKSSSLKIRHHLTHLWLVLAFHSFSEVCMNNRISTTTESWNKNLNITNSSHFYLYWFLQSPGLQKASLFNSHCMCINEGEFSHAQGEVAYRWIRDFRHCNSWK